MNHVIIILMWYFYVVAGLISVFELLIIFINILLFL